jgi:YHS domain-containing protein
MLDQVVDPVCGMQMDPEEAADATEYNGEVYYFCSDHCKEKFDRGPTDYAVGTYPI